MGNLALVLFICLFLPFWDIIEFESVEPVSKSRSGKAKPPLKLMFNNCSGWYLDLNNLTSPALRRVRVVSCRNLSAASPPAATLHPSPYLAPPTVFPLQQP